jgi:hypothetical protein
MSDTLYLSLWYPNLRLAGLADKLTAVLGAFATHGGEARVYSATVWPVSWKETPIFQQVYGRRSKTANGSDVEGGPGADPRLAVVEALELLHDDYAYEFQIGWSLWELELAAGQAGPSTSLRPAAGYGLWAAIRRRSLRSRWAHSRGLRLGYAVFGRRC